MSMKQAIKLQNIGLNIMAHTCKPHTLEAEGGGLLAEGTVQSTLNTLSHKEKSRKDEWGGKNKDKKKKLNMEENRLTK